MNHLKLLSTAIKFYSRPDIKQAIFSSSLDREFVPKILSNKDIIFGSRPNQINYPDDLDFFIKSRAVSFHISEERWTDPLKLVTGINDKELNSLRKGWDLVIDIDFPLFEVSKLIAAEIVNALLEHGIKTIYAKFSGNKGFHIAVPFEVFPVKVNNIEIKDTFPELPSRVLSYLSYYIDNPNNNFNLSRKILAKVEDLPKELIKDFCLNCLSEVTPSVEEDKYIFVCKKCGNQKELTYKEYSTKKYLICDKCNGFMELTHVTKRTCPNCGSEKLVKKVNLGLDSILISKRHLFRSPYSLHEKSLLCSLPISYKEILDFEREFASPESVKVKYDFLPNDLGSRDLPVEATKLFIQALDFTSKQKINKERKTQTNQNQTRDKNAPQVYITTKTENQINLEFFPPCILEGLKGLEDGRKRFLFILINFLNQLNWSSEQIKELILEWNKKNAKELPPSIIKAQLNYHIKRKNMPPNCSSEGFYLDIGICKKDAFCNKIKNPVSYALKKYFLNTKNKKTNKDKS